MNLALTEFCSCGNRKRCGGGTGGRKKAEKLVEAAAANMWLDYCAAEKVAFLYILEDFREEQ
jgi:hypothetical protein